jgi:hypothetical protein
MHLFPQLPQLLLSVCRLNPSSIIPLQLSSFPLHVSVVGVAAVALHVPYADHPLVPWQYFVCVPVLWHAPIPVVQLWVGAISPSSIIPLQLSSFPLHVSFVGVFALHVPYAPLLHVCVPVHVPYALLVAQFFVVLFMHPVHAPFTHDCPDWQVTPQLPQLFISFGAAS